jgi:hypothetical protein
MSIVVTLNVHSAKDNASRRTFFQLGILQTSLRLPSTSRKLDTVGRDNLTLAPGRCRHPALVPVA